MTSDISAGRGSTQAPGGEVEGPEIWTGLECTLNRVGDTYLDQLVRAGHYERETDIDRLADLGVRGVRYPVLWERHQAHGEVAWQATARALERLRARGVTPIVGLVHHGSGPRHTHLADRRFISGLARFAAEVAQRFPWVRHFTPINEPMTTARFSFLYGHWYPHVADDRRFVRAVLVQALAIVRAMAAIRAVIPEAELVQTEDLGYTHSTPVLKYQADFENERRWLTFDLLVGRVRPGHPLWRYLGAGRDARDLLDRIADAPTPPGIVGINHYLTSERFLDHRLTRYPPSTHGGNGRHHYADVEAIRTLEHGPVGPRRLLQETWFRYGIPIAVTEAHLGCTREQQARWLREVIEAARAAAADGADIRAVTAWAAFGSFDWPSLVTRDEGVYESGLFDVRAPEPRETILAAMVRAAARGEPFDHPILDSAGWWQCDRRLLFRASTTCGGRDIGIPLLRARETAERRRVESNGRPHTPLHVVHRRSPRPLLITGCRGTLGHAIERACADRQLAYVGVSREALDITDPRAVAELLDEVRPWAVVNAAGYVRVDDAEKERESCRWTNTIGPAVLADRCATRGIGLVTFSSDLVFDGSKGAPYVESDAIAPLNTYGRSKAEAERLVREIMPSAMVVRTSAFFGPWDDHNFVSRTLAALASGRRVRVPDDAIVSPTYVPDLVDAVLDLLIDGASGIWHVANPGVVSWAQLAMRAAAAAGISTSRLTCCASREMGQVALRPMYSALGSERGSLLAPIDRALARYATTRAWERLVRREPRREGEERLAPLQGADVLAPILGEMY